MKKLSILTVLLASCTALPGARAGLLGMPLHFKAAIAHSEAAAPRLLREIPVDQRQDSDLVISC
jgi:hypothetical protein